MKIGRGPGCFRRKGGRDEVCLVECFIGKLKYFRRVCTRFDKYAKRFLAFVHFAMVVAPHGTVVAEAG